MAPSGQPPFRIENCLGRPLCLPDMSLSVWPRLDAEVYRSHAEPHIALRSNSIALIMEYVAVGKGISFLTWLDAAAGAAEGRFRFAKPSWKIAASRKNSTSVRRPMRRYGRFRWRAPCAFPPRSPVPASRV
ncbi:hypothetical protein NKY44_08855 [Sinorhizobium meliloti]|uniref:hypothetical protein n=1 Tax=Rhizobium meliloti TaxID=382 RepID=UPI003D661832